MFKHSIIYKKEFPKTLSVIEKTPDKINCIGDTSLLNKECIAIVGSRKISDYGRSVTKLFSQNLAQSGLVIVSGLALGVDAVAHEACIEAGGKTIAVLGSGLNKITPRTNLKLAKRIIDSGGLIISEFDNNEEARPYYFPQRNRIISGLSLGTLVTEAAEKSGALITAYFALDQNRDVFAVPGSIYNLNSRGANKIISKGAYLVQHPDEILNHLGIEKVPMFKEKLTAEEMKIINIIEKEEVHINKISKLLNKDINRVSATLMALELKGVVTHLGSQIYCLKR